MFYNLLPMFLGVAQDYRQLDNQAIGLLSLMFFAGGAFSTVYGIAATALGDTTLDDRFRWRFGHTN